MKKGGGSESTIIIGPSKSVLVYALHSLENVLGLARFRVFASNMYVCILLSTINFVSSKKNRYHFSSFFCSPKSERQSVRQEKRNSKPKFFQSSSTVKKIGLLVLVLFFSPALYMGGTGTCDSIKIILLVKLRVSIQAQLQSAVV